MGEDGYSPGRYLLRRLKAPEDGYLQGKNPFRWLFARYISAKTPEDVYSQDKYLCLNNSGLSYSY